MSEPIKISIDDYPVEFVMNGETLATFSFFELESALRDAGKDSDQLLGWMRSKGLPAHVTPVVMDRWLMNYLKHYEDSLKK